MSILSALGLTSPQNTTQTTQVQGYNGSNAASFASLTGAPPTTNTSTGLRKGAFQDAVVRPGQFQQVGTAGAFSGVLGSLKTPTILPSIATFLYRGAATSNPNGGMTHLLGDIQALSKTASAAHIANGTAGGIIPKTVGAASVWVNAIQPLAKNAFGSVGQTLGGF
jgi:hypothetical protein